MPKPRILHVSYFKEIGAGHVRQLDAEYRASTRMTEVEWHTVAYTSTLVDKPWARRVPTAFRFPQGGKLYFWLSILRRARSYDAILVRHTIPDPIGPFVAPIASNIHTLHHTKELDEIAVLLSGIKRRLVRWWERRIIPIGYRRIAGVVGVTGEIARYEADRLRVSTTPLVYPNGFDFEGPEAADSRSDSVISIVFVASTFFPWHGLDRLLDSLAGIRHTARPVHLHLVGDVPDELTAQIAQLAAQNSYPLSVHQHGSLNTEEISKLYATAHVAVASLALDREHLSEASTLKVREYLAAGVPVYSTHVDSALPADFDFYHLDAQVSAQNLIRFALTLSHVPRTAVTSAARAHLDKFEIMSSLANSLFATSDQP